MRKDDKAATAAEPTGEKLARFMYLNKSLRELQAEYRSTVAKVVEIGKKIRSTPGWGSRSAQFPGKPQAAPVVPITDAVKSKLVGLVEIKNPEPIEAVDDEFAAIKKRSQRLEAEAATLKEACGILLYEHFDAMIAASQEECTRLAPESDVRKSRIVQALTELMNSISDTVQAFVKTNFADRNLSWAYSRPLATWTLLDAIRIPASMFITSDGARSVHDNAELEAMAKSWREHDVFRQEPETHNSHPKKNRSAFSRSAGAPSNAAASAPPLKLAAKDPHRIFARWARNK